MDMAPPDRKPWDQCSSLITENQAGRGKSQATALPRARDRARCSVHHDGADAFALVHQVEPLVDL
ncbi:hypothetical protein, partial [Ruegeria aquimaris]|uniref:hypothetical protein n=1 Tax=Ruegeria aquimaris TaxID=2984333 RepID=UPI0021E70C14